MLLKLQFILLNSCEFHYCLERAYFLCINKHEGISSCLEYTFLRPAYINKKISLKSLFNWKRIKKPLFWAVVQKSNNKQTNQALDNIVVTIYCYGNYPLNIGWKSWSTRVAENLSRKNSVPPQYINSVLNERREYVPGRKQMTSEELGSTGKTDLTVISKKLALIRLPSQNYVPWVV